MTLFLQNRLESIAEQWELLTQKTSEKSMKLKEANRQRTFIAAVKVSLIYLVFCTAHWKCIIKNVIILIIIFFYPRNFVNIFSIFYSFELDFFSAGP